MDPPTVPDPIAWILEQLRNRLPVIIRVVGYVTGAEQVDEAAVEAVLDTVESVMRGG